MAFAQPAEPLPSLPVPKPDPAIVRTLGAEPFRVTGEIAAMDFSPDGGTLFIAHLNESRVSVLDAKSGEVISRLPLYAQALGFSRDGRLIAGVHNASDEQTIRRSFGVWRWPDRAPLWTKDELGMPALTAFSPNGKMIAASGSIPRARSGKRVWVFDAETGRELWHADVDDPERKCWDRGLVWLGNDRVLATFSAIDEGARLFDAKTGSPLPLHETGEALADCRLTMAPDAPLLAAWSELHFRLFRVLPKGELELLIEESAPGIYSPEIFSSLDLSPDGRFLFLALGKECHVYDVERRERVRTPHPGGEVARFSPDGKGVLISRHSSVATFAVDRWEPLRSAKAGHRHVISKILFSPDGALLASCDGEEILLWEVKTGAVKARIRQPDHERGFEALIFHPTEPLLIAGDGGGVYWWDFSLVPPNASSLPADAAEPTHKRIWHWSPPPNVKAHCLALDSAGRKLLITLNDRANLMELPTDPRAKGTSLRNLTLEAFGNLEQIEDATLWPDGRRISLAAYREARTYEIQPERLLGQWPIQSERGTRAFSPDSRFCALNGSYPGSEIIVMDTESGAIEATLPLLGGKGVLRPTAGNKAWSASGTRLASAVRFSLTTWSGFYVWDMETARLAGVKETARGHISAIALSPDGRHLANANADGAIEIWDLAKTFEK